MKKQIFATIAVAFILAGCAGTPGTIPSIHPVGETRHDPGDGSEIRPVLSQEQRQAILDSLRMVDEKLQADSAWLEGWLQAARLQARLGRFKRSASALERAVQLQSQKPELLFELSRTWSMAGEPEKALEAIEKALQRKPDNRDYLEARARLANWLGDYSRAVESYRRLADLSPENADHLLNMARANAWGGYLDQAERLYRDFLSRQPDSRQGHEELIKALIWKGHYPKALAALDVYRGHFGEEGGYRRLHAEILARMGNGNQALRILHPLMEKERNLELETTEVLALHASRRFRLARQRVTDMLREYGNAGEVASLNRYVSMPDRTRIDIGGSYYADADRLHITSLHAQLHLRVSDALQFQAGQREDWLRARQGSPFVHRDGKRDARHSRSWLGAMWRPERHLELKVDIGTARGETERETPVYEIHVKWFPVSTFRLSFLRERGFLVISPRSVSLGILSTANRMNLDWRIDPRNRLDISAGLEDYSDENRKWEVMLFPRRLVWRKAKVNLDLGVRAWWFGFSMDPGSGYWSPEWFESYMAAAFLFWKPSMDDGLSLQLAAGWLRDSQLRDFRFGYSLDALGLIGAFRKVHAKIRFSYLHNLRQPGGSFNAVLISLGLIYRP